MSGSYLCIPRNETVQPSYFQNRIICSVSQFLHSYICERFIYFQSWSAYSAARKYVDRSWDIYKSLTDTWMWKLGLRPRNSFFWEYINRNFFAVYLRRSMRDPFFRLPLLLKQKMLCKKPKFFFSFKFTLFKKVFIQLLIEYISIRCTYA
jgi:hypothetical protein